MMRRFALLMITALSLLPCTARAAAPVDGDWINPHGTVIVTTGACHDALCGRVSWVSATASSDATQAGVPHLVGTQLLTGYRPHGPGRWTGHVYVPDMGRRFSSTIEQLDADRLKISGCLLGNWLCTSQIWTRRQG